MWVRINRGPLYSKAILNRLKWRKRLGVEPSPPAEQGATDFEDREGHRAPFASMALRLAEAAHSASNHTRNARGGMSEAWRPPRGVLDGRVGC